jgi:hypothetical protein
MLLSAALLLPLSLEWHTGWRSELLNRLHVPLFALFAITLPARRAWLAILVAALAELVQPWFGRSASLTDFAWGVLGVIAAMLWQARGLWRRGIAAFITFAPPLMWCLQVHLAQNDAEEQFPILLNQTPSLLWEPSPGVERAKEGFILPRGTSVRIRVPQPDWNAFPALELHATLEAATPLEVGIRLDIGDGPPNRVQAGTTLQPGDNHLRIAWPPNARLSPVKQLVLFLPSDGPDIRLKLQKLQLVRTPGP